MLPTEKFRPRPPLQSAFTIPACALWALAWAPAAKHHAREDLT
jgi:hypothetical protein